MIYIEPIHTKWNAMSDISRVDKDFEQWLANKYVEIVKRRVSDQKYKQKWKELSPTYKKWKEDNNLSPKIWEATGELIQNLKVKSNKVVGFDNRKRHKGSGETYLGIARKLEYGDSTVPARPLFRLTYWYLRKNIAYFYKLYLKEVSK